MLKVIFDEKGTAYSDFVVLEQAEKFINNYHNKGEDVVNISTETMLDAFRLCVLQKKISYDDICFVIMNNTVFVDELVNYKYLPDEFVEITSYMLQQMRLIRMSNKY